MKRQSINQVIYILKKEIKQWKTPAVGIVAEESQDLFKILISCILSLRTKDEVTDTASHRLFEKASTPSEMLKLSAEAIQKLIYPVGFYKTKSQRILEISQALIDRFNTRVPNKLEDLLSLKGVGRKTANLVITLGFGKDGICVDTHVHRISNRLGWIKTKNAAQTEFALMKILPRRYWKIYNDLLVTYGQNLCRPITPFCSRCSIETYCEKRGVTKHR
jgi:endonuclease-3